MWHCIDGELAQQDAPEEESEKAPTGSGQIQGLGVKPPEFDELSQKVLKGLLQRCFSFSSMRFNLYKKWQHELVGGCHKDRHGEYTSYSMFLVFKIFFDFI